MIINHLDKLNFENIFNSLPISILIIDKSLNIEYANLKAKEELNFNDRIRFKSIENINKAVINYYTTRTFGNHITIIDPKEVNLLKSKGKKIPPINEIIFTYIRYSCIKIIST